MRQSNFFVPTLREAPSDAEVKSHQLLLRAGYIRQLAAGIYTYLPLGIKVLNKVVNIVRNEMDKAGAQEILMPAMQPAELWHESGRYSVYGPELIRLKDRHRREFALGPTHEEVVTTLVKNEVYTYKKLPLTLYQIQTKFRDERRPRFGLLRGREFLMKDAYSFDLDWEGLDKSYWNMFNAYTEIFKKLELNFKAVEADAGAIGGEGGTHEFMALAEIGEDTIVSCSYCSYTANLEKAISGEKADKTTEVTLTIEKFHTPHTKTIEELENLTGVSKRKIIKTLIYKADNEYIAVLIRGDHEVNEIKLKNVLSCEELELAEEQLINGLPFGYIGPVDLNIPIWVDKEVANMDSALTGANELEYHYRHVKPGRDFNLLNVYDIRNVCPGDVCPKCNHELEFHRGIEVGHVFKLGEKYSEKLGAKYLDYFGKDRLMVMGCYGIGVSRILSAIVEQKHDDNGIIWPSSIAPFQVHVITVSNKDEAQRHIANDIYDNLLRNGIEVLYDDRDERIGVKLKDADLIGIPLKVTIGKQAAEGLVELQRRGDSETKIVSQQELLATILEIYNNKC